MRTLATILIALLISTAVMAEGSDRGNRHCRPVGTWLVNITFPDIILPDGNPLRFQELLSLNADRTLQETNSGLHPNTNPLAGPPGSPPITGSDGFGTWKRLSGCRIRFSQLKFVFAGDGPSGGPPQGVPIGFFKISGIARIVGNMYVGKPNDVTAELIVGTDPLDPEAPRESFGESVAEGTRILATD